jgi:hypothetical protein
VRTEGLSDPISQFGLDGEIITSTYYQEFLAGVKREFSGKGKKLVVGYKIFDVSG